MATVTITEILGGDNIAASRIVLNNNFTLLQNAINTLETRLNTSYVPGGSLNAGDVQILKYTRAATVNMFLCQGSAQIDGNLGLGTPTNSSTLSITGALALTGASTVSAGVTFSNAAGTNTFINNLKYLGNDAEANAQWYDVQAKNPVADINALGGDLSTTPSITNTTRVLWMDFSSVTTATTLVMPATTGLLNGQRVTLIAQNACSSNVAIDIDNATNFALPFDNTTVGANIYLNGAAAAEDSSLDKFGGVWVDLIATTAGWRIIGAHPWVHYGQ